MTPFMTQFTQDIVPLLQLGTRRGLHLGLSSEIIALRKAWIIANLSMNSLPAGYENPHQFSGPDSLFRAIGSLPITA